MRERIREDRVLSCMGPSSRRSESKEFDGELYVTGRSFPSFHKFAKDVLITFRLDDFPGFLVILGADAPDISFQSLLVKELQVDVGMNGVEWNVDPGQM